MKLKHFIMGLVVLLIVMLCSSVQTEASSFKQVQLVNGSSLVVKQAMSTSSKTLATLSRGDFVVVVETKGNWSFIEVGGIRGYVNATFLTTPQSTIKVASSKGGLVVKASPSTASKTLATLKHQMVVEDFGSPYPNWSYVQYGNTIGYVNSNFITRSTPVLKIAGYMNGHIPVRNIASWSGEALNTLKRGTTVNVHASLAGWSYVTAGTKKGYVPSNWLQHKPAKAPKTLNPHTLVPTDKRLLLTYRTNENVIERYYYKGPYGAYTLMSTELNGQYGNLYGVVDHTYTWAVASSDAGVRYQLPIVEGETTKIDGMLYPRSAYVTSTSATVEVEAGIFYNVLTLSYDGYQFHFAPGIGILKINQGNRLQYQLWDIGRY